MGQFVGRFLVCVLGLFLVGALPPVYATQAFITSIAQTRADAADRTREAVVYLRDEFIKLKEKEAAQAKLRENAAVAKAIEDANKAIAASNEQLKKTQAELEALKTAPPKGK